MSSPFSIFRKNQRVWMAALVVVAMVSFIILPMFSSMMDQGPGYTDKATAVRWKNGSMSVSDVRNLTASYQRSYQFLDRLARETVQAGGRPTVPGFSMDGNQMMFGLDRPQNVQQAVQTYVLAEEARRHGVNIDDKTVDLFIQELTNGKISQDKYLELMRESAGRDLNRFQLYRFIKDEIAKRMYIDMQNAGMGRRGMPLVTPAANWENFQRFEQRAKIEVYPVFTQAFMDKVTETPSDKELREIYEKGKSIEVDPRYSPEFGFFRRYEADFEYVRGYVERFVEAEKANLTEEQIKAEYDRRVAAGEFRVKDEVGELQPTLPETKQPETKQPETKQPETTQPETTQPETKPSESSNASSAENAVTSPTSSAENSTPPQEQSPAPADSGYQLNASTTRLVAFQEAADSNGANPPAESSSKTDTIPSVEPSVATDAQPVAEAVTEATKMKFDEPSTTATPDAPATIAGAATTSQAIEAAKDTAPTRIQSLEEVRGVVTRDLVRIPAQSKLQESMRKAYEAMEKYQQDLQYHLDAERTGFDKVPKPDPLDLTKIADENGLEYGRTGFINTLTAEQTDLGKSVFQNQSSFNSIGFARLMLNKQIPQYAAYPFDFLGENSNFSTFLAWKVDQKDGFVPTFENAREEVLNAWKTMKARELAKAEAEAILSKVSETADWSVLSETDQALVIRPTPFTWLQPPSFFSPEITTSLVDDLGEVDNDFMVTAFNTVPGSYAICSSINKDRFLVLKAVEKMPADQELMQKFGNNPMTPASQRLSASQMQANLADNIQAMIKRLQLDLSALSADME